MSSLKATCEKINTQFLITDYKKPYSTNENSVLIKVCRDEMRKMNLPDEPTTQSSTNEASLWNRIGIECVAFGPGIREGNINTPNEHVSVHELEQAVDFYQRIITRFCL
jgi:succinyl-diaminopimelate desuccinylase